MGCGRFDYTQTDVTRYQVRGFRCLFFCRTRPLVLCRRRRVPRPRAPEISRRGRFWAQNGAFFGFSWRLQCQNLVKCPTRQAMHEERPTHEVKSESRRINARLRVIFFVPADSCSLQREALAWLILLGGLAGMSPSSELRSGAWLPGSLAGWLRGTTRQSPLEGVSFRAPHCYRSYDIVRKQTNGEFALDEREHICNH